MSTVHDNQRANRYELHDDGHLIGIADYVLSGDAIAFTHTEVPPEFGGRSYARELVTEALTDAARRKLSVEPRCSYVAKVIADDAARFLQLVKPEDRERYGLPSDHQSTEPRPVAEP